MRATVSSTAVVVVTTGILGIASVVQTQVAAGLPVLVVGASPLTIVWLVLVGGGLLGSRWSASHKRDRT